MREFSLIGDALDAKKSSRESRQRRNGKSEKQLPPLAKAEQLLGLGDDHFRHVWRPTSADEAPLTAETAAGVCLRWKRQRDMLKPAELAFPALALGLGPQKPLTLKQAHEVYRALVGACETLERVDSLTEAQEWVEGFLAITTPLLIRPKFDAAETFVVLQDFRDMEALSDQVRRRTDHWTPPALVDQTHRFVRRADLATYIREAHHTRISYEALTGRVAEIGWEHYDVQAWEPDVPRREAQHVRVRAYRQELGAT